MPTVAIIGARGIGKHHANWWTLAGIKVCAFAGTSPDTVRDTAAMLRKTFGVTACGYANVADMLAAEKPDFVDVCSPSPLHGEHVRAALAAGCDVLCEKPFLLAPGRSAASLLTEADALLAQADAADRRLGLCSQYAVFSESCLQAFGRARPDETVTTLGGEIASPAKGRPLNALETWFDLGPHLLAAAQALTPGGGLERASLRVTTAADSTRCEFRILRPDAPALACHLHTHRALETGTHARRLSLNGVTFDLAGEKDTAGVFAARILSPLGDWSEDDPMRQLIRRFAAGTPPLDGPAARQNLAWLLAVADAIRAA